MIAQRMPDRVLRVAHLTPGLEVGGLEKLLVEFACHADRRKVLLHFISLSTRGQLADDIEACGWPVTALGVASGFRPGLIVRLARLFRRLEIDVVHTHDDRSNIYGAPAARLARVRRVIHTRHHQGALLSRRQTWLVNLVARCTDRFVCVSRDGANRAVEHGVRQQRVTTIWNGIDVTRFAYSGPNPTGPAVIVARVSPEKDIESLLRATALVVREKPAFRLEIAGDGPCRQPLMQLARELGLNNNVTFLGHVKDIPELLTRCSFFVLSSQTEGVSLTLLEAMARGLPVVATRVGGNVEVVAEGETGLLVPCGDPAALALAMLECSSDPERAARMGRAARQRVEEYFDIRRMVSAYEDLYLQP
jgi:glycosyltransferase involved in cell wall biosynthesis